MTLRENSIASRVRSENTTLGVFGFSKSSKVSSMVNGLTRVAISVPTFPWSSSEKQLLIASICSG